MQELNKKHQAKCSSTSDKMPIKKKAILTAAVAPIVDRAAVTLPSVDEEKSGIPQDK